MSLDSALRAVRNILHAIHEDAAAAGAAGTGLLPLPPLAPTQHNHSSAGSGLSEAGGELDAATLGMSTAPAEFYDPEADDKDEAWAARMRRARHSDAILSCPLCFTTLCIDCQQHERYENQFRAMFVMNCR